MIFCFFTVRAVIPKAFRLFILIFCMASPLCSAAQVMTGIDQLFTKQYESIISGKNIGLITNQTGVNSRLQSTISLLKYHQHKGKCTLVALFAPEHGLTGQQYASESVSNTKDKDGIPIYSLHGKTRRPTSDMLKNIDLLIYDIQDIGCRSYTYVSTLFFVMEEAAKLKIPVLVLDRPNPINGMLVDGPMLEEEWRSMVGYINVPYCHGMTVGELAQFFNTEYHIDCPLTVIPMKGWKRNMSFQQTGLTWIPSSPQIPEANTAFYYPITGLIGELSLVNIGVGYTLPFKVIGAPFIDGPSLAQTLNSNDLPGVRFQPMFYRPFFGRFAKQDCQGVLIVVTDPLLYQPFEIQRLILGTLKNIYPQAFKKSLELTKEQQTMFHKLNGTPKVYQILKEQRFIIWKLKELHQKERALFLTKRSKYLFQEYQ